MCHFEKSRVIDSVQSGILYAFRRTDNCRKKFLGTPVLFVCHPEFGKVIREAMKTTSEMVESQMQAYQPSFNTATTVPNPWRLPNSRKSSSLVYINFFYLAWGHTREHIL
jgi:hypothetical protein